MSTPEVKTYVWHDGVCYYVSTIHRESSAIGGPRFYNETMVWRYNWNAAARGDLLWNLNGDDSAGFIDEHLRIVRHIYEHGEQEARP